MSTAPAAPALGNISSVALTREQLYDIVWSEPIRTVATRYGLSDRGLAKICVRLHVPVPGRGYWQQKAVGKKVRQPPLKALDPDTPPSERAVTLGPRGSSARRTTSETVAEQSALESAPDRLIQVAAELNDPHPLIERTARALRRRKPDERGLRHPSLKRCLDVHVSTALIDRALRILNALVRALEGRGYAITCPVEGPHRTVVVVDGEQINVCLEEKVDQAVIPEPKSILPRRLEYSFLRPSPRYSYTATGQLILRIADHDLRMFDGRGGTGSDRPSSANSTASSLDSSRLPRRRKPSAGELKSRARPMRNGCARLCDNSEDGSRSERFSAWNKILAHSHRAGTCAST